MNSKKKIIFYIDWTDCLAHLTGDEAYSIGETKEERRMGRERRKQMGGRKKNEREGVLIQIIFHRKYS